METTTRGYTLDRAGVRPGDVLLSWERLPSPPENPEPAAGELSSPFDWEWMVIEQSMRGTLKLTGERQGRRLTWIVLPGFLAAEVRPVLPSALLEPYERGRERFRQKQVMEGIDCWRWVEEKLRQAGDGQRAGWLALRLARSLTDLASWAEAEVSFQEALASVGDSRSKVVVFDAMRDFYAQQGRLREAEQSSLARLRLAESTWGESLETAESQSLLGVVLRDQWQSDAAEECFQQALTVQEKLAPNSRGVVSSLLALGSIANSRGELDRAELYWRGALERSRELEPSSMGVSTCLNNVASVYMVRGDLDAAEDLLRQALQHEKKEGREENLVLILNNLGDVFRLRGETDAAENLFLQSVHLLEKLAPDRPVPEAIALFDHLGRMAKERGDLRGAAEYFTRGLTVMQRLGLAGTDRAILLLNLGDTSMMRGELKQAESYLREALALSDRFAPESMRRAEALYLLASVLRRAGATVEAEGELSRALEILEKQIDRLGGSLETKGGFRAQEGDIYRAAVRQEVELGHPREAFRLLEQFRAQSFLALMAERDLAFTAEIPAALDRERRRLTALYDDNELRLATLDPDRERAAVEELQREQVHLRGQRAEVAAKIHEASPRLAAMIQPQPLSFEQVRTALDPGTVLLSYCVGKEATQLFVATPGRDLAVRTLPIGDEALRQEITRLRQLVEAPSGLNVEGLDWASRRLYRLLVQPAERWIAAGERILIVPDGPLHLLPFAALIDRNGKYLIERKPLHTVLSGTVYAELKERRRSLSAAASPLQWVAFGDPWFPPRLAEGRSQETGETRLRSFSTRTGLHWQRLPESRREVERIADLYPPATRRVYLDREATEEKAKALGREARIVHFATHGFVDDRSPFDSGLVLAIPEQFTEGHDNGLLQVWEIFESMRLDADLVVLSACETGLGEIRGGEGIIGLTRAFQYAGARSVLASLWRVDDRATAELMERFYRHLRGGESKDVALRAAQREMIAKKTAAPYFWAAMQLYGGWR